MLWTVVKCCCVAQWLFLPLRTLKLDEIVSPTRASPKSSSPSSTDKEITGCTPLPFSLIYSVFRGHRTSNTSWNYKTVVQKPLYKHSVYVQYSEGHMIGVTCSVTVSRLSRSRNTPTSLGALGPNDTITLWVAWGSRILNAFNIWNGPWGSSNEELNCKIKTRYHSKSSMY